MAIEIDLTKINEGYDLICLHRCCNDGMQSLLKYSRDWANAYGKQPRVRVVGIFNIQPYGYADRYGIDPNDTKNHAYLIDVATDYIRTIPNRLP